MDLLTEIQKIRGKLGEKLSYQEYLDVKKYLEENPDLPLNDLYNSYDNWDKFQEWRIDQWIKENKVFVTIYENGQMKIDYLEMKKNKYDYISNGYIYDRNQLFLSLEDAEKSLKDYNPGYVFTPNATEYINSTERDRVELIKEYYGICNLKNVWFDKVNELYNTNNISKIYEVYTKGFLGAWYLIKDKDDNRYIVKHKVNDVNTKFMMNQFLNKIDYEKLESGKLDVMQYDTLGKKEYEKIIFNFVINFKNSVESKYYKLNLNTNEIIDKFIEDNNDLIEKKTRKHLKDNILIGDNEELKQCFIKHIKFDIKCKIQSDLNSLNFSKNNWYINENNVDEFSEEFTRKIINGEHIEQLKNAGDFSLIKFEEEIEVNKNKLELYFYNAYELFPVFIDKNEYYYDGYLSLNLENNTSKIEIVEINDNDDRQYYEYMPTRDETEMLFKATEKYCQEYHGQTLEEYKKESIEEEDENEQ